ncbi:hypothetical protein SOVF_186420 [Spinacia oleracea]|nr:hypothetical protein SOVF_186420 [Spinacia oleracea]
MHQTSLFDSGFYLDDLKDFVCRIYDSAKSSFSINPDATVEQEDKA